MSRKREPINPLDIGWMPEGFSTAQLLAVPAHMVWTPEMVQARLVEAARVVEATVRRPGPSKSANLWPQIVRDWADIMDHKAEDQRVVRFISRAQINRMEEALLWPGRYLKDEPGAGRVLRSFLQARAFRRSFSHEIKAKGWSTGTAYRSRDRALSIIALCLMRDEVAP